MNIRKRPHLVQREPASVAGSLFVARRRARELTSRHEFSRGAAGTVLPPEPPGSLHTDPSYKAGDTYHYHPGDGSQRKGAGALGQFHEADALP